MKNLYIPFITFTLLLFAAKTPAQETFAPLITENTALFVHVDFRKVEIDAVKESWTRYADNLTQSLRFDAASQRATLAALGRDLNRLDKFIRPTFETITQELGIRELAVIVDTDFKGGDFPVFMVVPWKDKTDDDLQTLVSLLTAVDDHPPVPIADFLFLVTDEEALREWFESVKPSEVGIMQAMNTLGDDEIKIAFSMTDTLRDYLLHLLRNDVALPEPAINILTHVARRVEWATISFPNPLMAEEKPPVKMTVKASSAADARQLRMLLESGIDMAITAWQAYMAMARTFDDSMTELPEVVYALARGYLRTMLPVVEGDMLTFQQPEVRPFAEFYMYTTQYFPLYAIFEDARRSFANRVTRCEMNLRQIGLALHNFHDVHNAFPPLYTVNEEGNPLHSWRVLILPFIGQVALYDAIRLDEPWDSEHNRQFHSVVIPQFVCPRNTIEGDMNCHYVVIIGGTSTAVMASSGNVVHQLTMGGGSFAPATRAGTLTGIASLASIVDGTSNTLAVVEVKEAFNWMDPTADITLEELMKGINSEGRVGSNHRGGANALFFDGSTFFLPDDAPADILRALGMPNSGIPIPREWRNW